MAAPTTFRALLAVLFSIAQLHVYAAVSRQGAGMSTRASIIGNRASSYYPRQPIRGGGYYYNSQRAPTQRLQQRLKTPQAADLITQSEIVNTAAILKATTIPLVAATALGSSMAMGASESGEEKEVGLARVGPNTLIQTVGALKDKYGEEKASQLLKEAGFGYLAKKLPDSMVQEMNFHNLVRGLKPLIGDDELADILFNAGSGTAQYLLRVRIPGFFQEFVKILPKKPALQLLLFAIGKAGAWTFRGSGEYYTVDTKEGVDIHVSVLYPSLPLVSNFYRGVFDYLIHTLVDPELPVVPDTNVDDKMIDCNIKCQL